MLGAEAPGLFEVFEGKPAAGLPANTSGKRAIDQSAAPGCALQCNPLKRRAPAAPVCHQLQLRRAVQRLLLETVESESEEANIQKVACQEASG